MTNYSTAGIPVARKKLKKHLASRHEQWRRFGIIQPFITHAMYNQEAFYDSILDWIRCRCIVR
ncbi:hypothetical protein BCO26_2676 [Heyndrickxia coagulans 2-6]|nr:hypothetical protein BCO26_2676 [Heyndrickxia coagulans 2-6]